MNTVPFIDRFAAAVGNKRSVRAPYNPAFDALKIPIIREGIENSDPQPKCGNF
jgi:hypothetical protein